MNFPFDNTYASLPERFFSRVDPTRVRDPRLVKINRPLAALLGLDADRLDSPEGAQIFAGNVVPPGATPIALAYAGHQFGHFAGQLGDGRAILLGEIVGTDGVRRDVQLKGAGRTPYSRGGDGRAALGPVLREYLVSEAMAALGVPTTRALAAVTTGEHVRREQMLPGAVITRVAASHLRVGTFELLAARNDDEGIKILTTYALRRHYPEAAGSANEALALLECVTAAQARLVARWLGLGFIHGVMNTDNTSISGETIDYGPCAFLDEYDPGKTFSSIDRGGRYAFANQPRIALWNLSRLAETLLPAIAEDQDAAVALATERLNGFAAIFGEANGRIQRAKIGLTLVEPDDPALLQDLLERLAANEVDFTLFYRRLCAAAADPANDAEVASTFADPDAFAPWAERWRQRLQREPGTPEQRAAAMRQVNPAFIPRNHRIEELITAAVERRDFGPFETFHQVLARPYEDQPEFAEWREPPLREQRVCATFCGT
jgi:uncharacterized protein YdiU (UPF0061 family)